MKALVIAEHSEAAKLLCAGARTLADEVALVVAGVETAPEGVADAAYHVDVPAGSILDDADKTIAPLVEGCDMVLVEPTKRMKSVAGKLAAAAGASVIADALSIEDGVATNMYFGGVGHAQRKATGVAFYTVSPNIYINEQASGANGAAEELAWVAPEHAVRELSSEPVPKSGIDLTACDAVVAAGRGFAEQDDLQLARDLADKIGAGLGCSRPLAEGVDWMPAETYIGVSGLILSPKVYVAAGISGQIQHMVGANRAGTVFAINKDENAPIFKQCDYGLIGDLKKILPAVTAAL